MEIYEAKCEGGVISILQDGVYVNSSDSMLTLSNTQESSTGVVIVGINASLYLSDGVGATLQLIADSFNGIAAVPAAVADTDPGGSEINQVVPKSALDEIATTLKSKIKTTGI